MKAVFMLMSFKNFHEFSFYFLFMCMVENEGTVSLFGLADTDVWVIVTFVGSFDRPALHRFCHLVKSKKCGHLWSTIL